MLRSINPYNGDPIREYPEHSLKEINERVAQSASAFESWKQTSLSARSELLKKLADHLEVNADEYAKQVTLEMGKPLAEAVAEIKKSSWVCRYYAEQGEAMLADRPIKTEFKKSFVSYQPLGPILAIMPWNFPYWQVLRFAAPTLMAGNTALLKHAENVSGCSLTIESAFRKVGFPEGAFLSLLVDKKNATPLVEHPTIAGISLTGSTVAGKSVAKGAANSLNVTVLELGGSDPYLIWSDADLARAAALCSQSRFINGGQSCIAAKRLIVESSVREKFEALMIDSVNNFQMGDPMLAATDLGPMARADLREQLHRQVTESIAMGARLLLGGTLPKTKGWMYPATLLSGVKPGMPAFDEELFGPVAVIIDAKDREESIHLANQTVFGLGAAIFSRDEAKAVSVAREQIQAGSVFVNDFVRSDPRLPFGGIKQSGFGRELSIDGIKEFVNVKTVVLNQSS